jgi:hypothetical protein
MAPTASQREDSLPLSVLAFSSGRRSARMPRTRADAG